MVNSIASGTAMTVTLPDIGKDLNIATANLQWIISGYTLTSVRRCLLILRHTIVLTLLRLFHYPRYTGVLPPLIRPTCRSPWATERLFIWCNLDGHLGHWVRVCSR